MNPYSVASWLANIDGSGASDEEFAETMVILSRLNESNNKKNDVQLNDLDMTSFDVDNFTGWINGCLDEVLFSKEFDESAWWKEKRATT